jgi:hypothetical protein
VHCGKSFAELRGIPARLQIEIFEHQEGLRAAEPVRHRLRHPHRAGRGDGFESGGLCRKHFVFVSRVEFDEEVAAIAAAQATGLIDATAADGRMAFVLEGLPGRAADRGGYRNPVRHQGLG